ncbi:hypothetical protein ABZ851_29955 [Streptomyces sp. NPDC047049]|uniref:hypothetical protein n=1 Tax=Streptomyces sp. NPDC047049 TaxID=3156688 RepID=UPI0033EF8B5B
MPTTATHSGPALDHMGRERRLRPASQGSDELADLLQNLVDSAQTGDRNGIDEAAAAIHPFDRDTLYECYDDLAERLDEVVVIAGVRAEIAAQAPAI